MPLGACLLDWFGPMTIKCEACKGTGEVYKRIAGDVHIAKCGVCEGWGSVDATPPKPKRTLKHFGSVNLNELLDE